MNKQSIKNGICCSALTRVLFCRANTTAAAGNYFLRSSLTSEALFKRRLQCCCNSEQCCSNNKRDEFWDSSFFQSYLCNNSHEKGIFVTFFSVHESSSSRCRNFLIPGKKLVLKWIIDFSSMWMKKLVLMTKIRWGFKCIFKSKRLKLGKIKKSESVMTAHNLSSWNRESKDLPSHSTLKYILQECLKASICSRVWTQLLE